MEEQFYLLWPLLIRRADPKRIIGICAAMVMLSMASALGHIDAWLAPRGCLRLDTLSHGRPALGGAVAALLEWPPVVRWTGNIPACCGPRPVVLLERGAMASRGSQFGLWQQTVGWFAGPRIRGTDPLSGCSRFRLGPTAFAAATQRFFLPVARYSYGTYMVHSPLGVCGYTRWPANGAGSATQAS